MGKYNHLRYEERVEIASLRTIGFGLRQIARYLGRSPNTISRELREKKVKGAYTPKKAQLKTYLRRYHAKRNCMKIALDPWLMGLVFKKLQKGWSPERIAGFGTLQGHPVSKSAVYRFVGSRCLERFLFWKRYRKRGGRKNKKKGKPLDKRKYIEERPFLENSGHLEADFIVSAHNSVCLLVVVDRYTRYTRIKRLPNRKHGTVLHAFEELLFGLNIQTITLDNDISFNHWKELQKKLDVDIYFTHPYSAWEKGLVENTNRWIRLFVPKRVDIQTINEETLKQAKQYLNEIPRQCLGYRTAKEVQLIAEVS